MYNRSKQHLDNLSEARIKSANTKAKCEHCQALICTSGLLNHTKNCHLNPIHLRLCVVCDNPIKHKKSVTCSRSCANSYFRTGTNSGNFKNGDSSYRTICFQHHKKKCIICGEQNIVEVHHYDEDHKNNDPKNLVPLCPTHHQYYHSPYKSLVKDKIDAFVNMV